MFNDQLMKGKIVEILKQLGDFQLFTEFYESQRLRLKTKGLTGQFLKMDVAKFQGLMKMKLNVHSDWDRWLSELPEVSQDYALALPLWIFTYERLYSDHKICTPPWVKTWLETRMTTESMTKDELRVWKLVHARINEDSRQHDVSGQQDDGSTATATTAREYADSRRRVTELLGVKPGTFVLTFRAPADEEPNEPTRIQESEEQNRFSIANHVDKKQACQGGPGRAAGAMIFDGNSSVHRVQYYSYDMLGSFEVPGFCIPVLLRCQDFVSR